MKTAKTITYSFDRKEIQELLLKEIDPSASAEVTFYWKLVDTNPDGNYIPEVSTCEATIK